MNGVRGAEFERLVARFNAAQADYRVVATYKGAYDEAVVEAVTARRAPPRAAPRAGVRDSARPICASRRA